MPSIICNSVIPELLRWPVPGWVITQLSPSPNLNDCIWLVPRSTSCPRPPPVLAIHHIIRLELRKKKKWWSEPLGARCGDFLHNAMPRSAPVVFGMGQAPASKRLHSLRGNLGRSLKSEPRTLRFNMSDTISAWSQAPKSQTWMTLGLEVAWKSPRKSFSRVILLPCDRSISDRPMHTLVRTKHPASTLLEWPI